MTRLHEKQKSICEIVTRHHELLIRADEKPIVIRETVLLKNYNYLLNNKSFNIIKCLSYTH